MAWTEDEEDLCQPPPGPSPREVRRRWAESGDVEALLGLIRETPWSSFSIHEQLRNPHRACEVRAGSDPAGFSGEVFSRMAAFVAYLVLRTQLHLAERVVGRGELPATPTIADLTNDVAERLLPRLLEMQRGLAEILAAQAQAARLWALTRAKEAQADRPVAADPKPPRRRRASGGKAGRPGREAAGAEGTGEVVSLPVRGRRRG